MEYRFKKCGNPWKNPLKGLALLKLGGKRITHAHAYMHKIPDGTIEIQVMYLDTAKFWWYEMEVTRRCLLSIYPYNSEFSLHFSLKNEIFVPFEPHPILIHEGNVVLIYMRNINYDISLLPGRYVFCQIDYNKKGLSLVHKEHEYFEDICKKAETTLGCSLTTADIPITPKIRRDLFTLAQEGSCYEKMLCRNLTTSLLNSFLCAIEDHPNTNLTHVEYNDIY